MVGGYLLEQECLLGSVRLIPGLATYSEAVVSYWQKYVHEVLVNCLGGLSMPRKSVVRLTDCPDMTLDVYHGHKNNNTTQIGSAQYFKLLWHFKILFRS